jgi:excisionase family DNA binding protein
MSKEIMTVEEVAERLRMSRSTILKYIREERLVAMRWGRVYRIRVADFDKFCKEGTRE